MFWALLLYYLRELDPNSVMTEAQQTVPCPTAPSSSPLDVSTGLLESAPEHSFHNISSF